MLDNNVLTIILVFLNVLLFALLFVCATFAVASYKELQNLRFKTKVRDRSIAALKDAIKQVERTHEDWSHAICNVIQAYPDALIDDVIEKYAPKL